MRSHWTMAKIQLNFGIAFNQVIFNKLADGDRFPAAYVDDAVKARIQCYAGDSFCDVFDWQKISQLFTIGHVKNFFTVIDCPIK